MPVTGLIHHAPWNESKPQANIDLHSINNRVTFQAVNTSIEVSQAIIVVFNYVGYVPNLSIWSWISSKTCRDGVLPASKVKWNFRAPRNSPISHSVMVWTREYKRQFKQWLGRDRGRNAKHSPVVRNEHIRYNFEYLPPVRVTTGSSNHPGKWQKVGNNRWEVNLSWLTSLSRCLQYTFDWNRNKKGEREKRTKSNATSLDDQNKNVMKLIIWAWISFAASVADFRHFRPSLRQNQPCSTRNQMKEHVHQNPAAQFEQNTKDEHNNLREKYAYFEDVQDVLIPGWCSSWKTVFMWIVLYLWKS